MTIIINAHIVLIALVLAVLLIGLILPKRKSAQRIFQLNSDPEAVWDLLMNHARQAKWRPGLKKVEIIAQAPDREAWTEYPVKGQPVTFKIRNKSAFTRVELDIIRAAAFGMVRVVELREAGFYQTIVTITEYTEVANPFTRVLVHFLFNPDETLERYAGDITAEMQRKNNRLESQTS